MPYHLALYHTDGVSYSSCLHMLLDLRAYPWRCRWRVHRCVAASVDALLEGRQPPSELRWRGPRGEVLVMFETQEAEQLGMQAMSG
jgi:hypothetical protein